MTVREFLLARVLDDEARLAQWRDDPSESLDYDQLRAMCTAIRDVVALDADDDVLGALAAIYEDHPDYAAAVLRA